MSKARIGRSLMLLALLGGVGAALCGCRALGVRAPTVACGAVWHTEVPRDAAAASRIARRYLADVVGEPSVLRQEPFTVMFDDYRWVVRGTLPPGQTHGRYLVVLDANTGCATYAGADDLGR